MTKDQKIAKLGKEITDRATVLLGKWRTIYSISA